MKNYYRLWRNHSQPWRFLTARLLMVTRLNRFLLIQRKGYRLHFDRSNVAMYRWIAPGTIDSETLFINAYLKRGDVVVDVGANVGETVLAASKAVGSLGQVFAFEPHPRTFSLLQRNLTLNSASNVRAFNLALGENQGTVLFSDDRRDDMNRVITTPNGTPVPVDTLDSLISSLPRIDLLKVDVEGYEKFVFRGASATLRRTACIFFEVSATHFSWFGYRTKDLLELLTAAGFSLFRLSPDNALLPVSLEYESAEHVNLIGVRDLAGLQTRTGWKSN
jgi:FkbM family methyltransferase